MVDKMKGVYAMKKTFWGYSIQEVDDNIGYLETQNIKLERQVKQLATELQKAKEDLENAALNADHVTESADAAEKDRLIAELQQKLTESNRENQELTAQSEVLKSKIAELSAVNASREPITFDDIGDICKTAYTDMHVTKQKTKEHIQAFLEQFWQEWNTYEKQLLELSEQVKSQQQESKYSFISYADYILQVYGDMENSNRTLDHNLSEILNKKAKIEEGLTALLTELDKGFKDDDDLSAQSVDPQEKENESETEDDQKYLILDAIKNMGKKRLDQEPSTTATTPQSEAAEFKVIPILEKKQAETPKDEMNISQKVNIRNII